MVRRTLVSVIIVLGLSLAVAGAQAPKKAAPAAPAAAHVMVTPTDLKWGPAPPVLPPGAEIAVLDGDPTKVGFFSIRLKMPDGYKVAPHWHPTDENIVVMRGSFSLGNGDTLNAAAAHELPAGSFAKMPKEVRHFALAKGETVIQIYGPGPFVVNYVNPKDDPSKKPTGR